MSECWTQVITSLVEIGADEAKRAEIINNFEAIRKDVEVTDKVAAIKQEAEAAAKTLSLAEIKDAQVKKDLLARFNDPKMQSGLKKEPSFYLKSIVDGTVASGTEGGELSLEGASGWYKAKYNAQLREDLGELEEVFKSATTEEKIRFTEAMSALKAEGDTANFTKEELQIGQAMNNLFDVQRKNLQEMGIRVGDQKKNWFGPQIHRQSEIAKVKAKVWVDDVMARIDKEKTATLKNIPLDIEARDRARAKKKADDFKEAKRKQPHSKVLRGMSDEEIKADIDKKVDEEILDLEAYVYNVRERIVGGDRTNMNGSRSIVFKDAKSKVEYDEMYGFTSLQDMTKYSIDRQSKVVGLHWLLGSNPQETWRELVSMSKEGTDPLLKAQLNDSATVEAYRRVLFGDPSSSALTNMESHFSDFTSWSMKLGRATKLPQSLLSTLPDTANTAAYFSAFLREGGGILPGLGKFYEAARAMPIVTVKGSDNWKLAREFDDLIGLARSEHLDRFDPISGPETKIQPKTSKIVKGIDKVLDLATKFNGLLWQEGVAKRMSVYMLANDLFELRGKNFDQLIDRTQGLLKSYGINNREWDIIRAYGVTELEGRNFLSPARVDDIKLSDPLLVTYAKENSVTPAQAKQDISVKFGSLINEWAVRTVPSGGVSAKVKIQSLAGNPARDTYRSNALALVMQFKSYPLSAWETVRRIGLADPNMDATQFRKLATKENFKQNRLLAEYVATGMALSMAAMWTKDLLNGKTPRKVDGTMLAQSATMAIAPISFGLMMDVLQGEFETKSLLGPTARDVDDLARITHAWFSNDPHKAAKTANALWDKVPFAKTLGVRPFLDNLIRDSFIQTVDPKYFRRLEKNKRRRLKESGQRMIGQ